MPNFPEWVPDAAQWGQDVASEASGVLHGANAYAPWPQPAASSIAAGTVIRGAIAARTTTNAIKIFAFSADHAYEFAGVGTAWTDRTNGGGGYNLAADDYWSARQYGTNIVFTNIADNVQTIVANGGGAATDLGGSPPKAKFVEIDGDFVVLGNTATSGRAIKNSARNDAAFWTAGQKDSDGQTFNDGGDVQGMTGLEVGGFIFQSDTARQLTLRQDAAIYETHKIEPARGTPSPYSIIKDGSDVYYYSNTGFMKVGGDGSFGNIGVGRVNDWFRENANIRRPKAFIGALDPTVRRAFWLCPSASNASSTTLDLLMCYDIDHDRWTHATTALTYIFPAAIPGTTLAELAALYATLTLVPYPFGSDVWKGGAPGLAAFDDGKKLCFFFGTNMAARVQTGPFEPVPGSRGFVKGFRLIGDAANATGRIGGTERPQTSISSFNGPQSVNAQGRVPCRISTRYAQIQIDIAAGEVWNHLVGVEFDQGDISPDGRR